MKAEDFKPCPLCGEAPEYIHFCDGFGWYERLLCNRCGLMLTVPGHRESDGRFARQLWNRRAANENA